MGFSLNNLTLFGLVLAIGIVVDDAIVVVEAVEHHIEHGLSPRDATIQAMDAGVRPGHRGRPGADARCSCRARSSRGITGQFFRQFALTIAVSTLISAFNSLTLSPALAALLLQAARRRASGPKPLPQDRLRPGRAAASATCCLTPYLRTVPRTISAGRWLGGRAGRRASSAAAAGWLVGPLLNRLLLGGLFRCFNAGFDGGHRRVHRASSAGCSASACSC